MIVLLFVLELSFTKLHNVLSGDLMSGRRQ
jgi:hypothetical protein